MKVISKLFLVVLSVAVLLALLTANYHAMQAADIFAY